MPGHCKQGFSLLEVLLAMTILAILGTIIVPRMLHKDPRQERQLFLAQLNSLVGFARQQAIITGKQHKLEFSFPLIKLFVASDKKNSEGQALYEPLKGAAFATQLTMPKHLEIKQFLLEGNNEMERFVGGSTKSVWFFVLPNGIAQAIIMNIIDKKDGQKGTKGKNVGWVLNPFSAQFKEYGEFQS